MVVAPQHAMTHDFDRLRMSRDVRASTTDAGLTLLDIKGGLVLASNVVGAHVWQSLAEGCTPIEAARRVAERFEVSFERAHADVQTFVASLIARGLVTRADAAAASQP